jgi:hypothetical protein
MSFTRACTSLIFATAVCAGPAAAQTPQQPPAAPDQNAAAAQTFTVAGCVQKEASVLKRNPAAGDVGMGDEFVLTFAAMNVGGAPPAQPSATPPAPGSFGTVYRLTGDKEVELKSFAGQRVEITGNFKDKDKATDAMSSVGTSGRELTPENTPEITIQAIKPISPSCSPSAK